MSYGHTFIIDIEYHPADGGDPAGYVGVNDQLGLVVEGETLDELSRKVAEIGPELFDLNIRPSLSDDLANTPPAFILKHALAA